MKGPKVTVIGAGSYFFGKPVIWNMVTSKVLKGGTLALVDTDADVLKTMMALGERAVEASGSPTRLIGSTDRREVMDGSDFIVLSFSARNAHYRGVDTRISKQHGVTMCSSDTIGPGGIFRALREIPEVLRIARDAGELCPDTWMINFINPTSVLGIALMRHAPELKSFALCDGNHMPYARVHYMKLAGLLPDDFDAQKESPDAEMVADFDFRVGGVNHFTFMTACTYKGEDRMLHVADHVRRDALAERDQEPSAKAKPRLNHSYARQIMDIFGAYPTAISHTKEYVPYFQGYGVTPNDPEPIIPFDAVNREEEMRKAWTITEELAGGKRPISEFLDGSHGDHATDIIESMWGGLDKPFFINGPNQGAVPNMPEDAFLELMRDVDMNGFKARPVGDMPRGLLGLQLQVLDTHELTVEAAVSCDRELLLRALCTDPIVNNIGDARRIMDDLLDAERDILPPAWYA